MAGGRRRCIVNTPAASTRQARWARRDRRPAIKPLNEAHRCGSRALTFAQRARAEVSLVFALSLLLNSGAKMR